MGTLKDYGSVSKKARDIHHVLKILIDELKAIDMYNLQAESIPDGIIKKFEIHNRDEEIEHFAITLEWLAENFKEISDELRSHLFKSGHLTENISTKGIESNIQN